MRAASLLAVALFGLWGRPVPTPIGDVRFEGNHSFPAKQLLAVLQNRYYVKLTGYFDVTEADDAAYFLRTFYFSRGFRDASVSYTYRGTRPPAALFDIHEGSRYSIGTVTFAGDSPVPPNRLREIFNATVRTNTLRPFGPMPYVSSAVEDAREAIVTDLQQRGYLTATADVTEPEPAANGLVSLKVGIFAGLAYSVHDVSFAGAPVSEETLRGVVKDYLNQPYQRNQESLMRTRIQDWLKNNGYLQAEVTSYPTIDPATGRVDISFNIDAGRTYTIGKIRIENAASKKGAAPISSPRAIYSRLSLHPGTLYNASAVDEAARRLWFSGAFEDAEIQRVPQPDGTVDLVVKLKETSAKRIQFGIGYSQWFQGIGELHYIDRNFFGTLNRLNLDATVSRKNYGISGQLTHPWLYGTDFEGSIGASYARRDLPAYKATIYGGSISLARRYDSVNLTGYHLSYGWKRVTDATVYGQSAADQANPDYTLGSVTFSQIYDTRNSIITPMRGVYLEHEEELASRVFLGDTSYIRLSAQATYYLPLREITTERPFVPFLVFNHRIGLLVPYGDSTTVPVQERYFLGGPDTVRSFQLQGLGPRDTSGNPIGGLGMLLFNAEVQWPVFNNIYVVAFADAGNLWGSARDIQPLDLQVGVGPGMRIYTPLGAVRVDYGYNLNRTPGDPIGAWQVGFGFTF